VRRSHEVTAAKTVHDTLVTRVRRSGILRDMDQSTPQAAQAPRKSVDVTGLPDEAIRAVEALVADLRSQSSLSPLHSAPYDEWASTFDEWVKSHPQRDAFADWTRESIYDGRGE
jgi:hypothetical protein